MINNYMKHMFNTTSSNPNNQTQTQNSKMDKTQDHSGQLIDYESIREEDKDEDDIDMEVKAFQNQNGYEQRNIASNLADKHSMQLMLMLAQ